MSSIDYLKFLLKKEEKTDEEREEDMQREEAYLISQGVIPKQRTIDPKIYDKLPEGFKAQFFNPHKTYDSDDKYKAIDKLKALLNKTNKVEMDTRNSKQQPDRNASDDEGSHTWYAMIEPEKQIPPSRVAGTAGSHPIHNKKDKIRSEFSQHRADRLPKTDVVDAETGDVIGEVSDDSGEYPEFHHERSISPNVARKLKAIDKLKALLRKETNSGEESHIEDKERQEKETKTPENLLTWSRVKREFDDETHEDPY